jgi:signal transduction histidine kinase/ligand-binding sensor domain-containing protein
LREVTLLNTLFLLLVCALLFSSSNAQEPIAQMYHRSWTAKEGAPANIEHIIQGPDGFVWITTDDGLYRFDGVTFERYRPPQGTAFLSNRFSSIRAARDGSIWVTHMSGGVTQIKGDTLTNFTQKEGLRPGHTGGLAEDNEGRIWVIGRGGLQFIRDGHVTLFHGAHGEGDFAGESVDVDRDGNLWISQWQRGLLVLQHGARDFTVASKSFSGGCEMALNDDGVLCTGTVGDPLLHFRVVGGKVVARQVLPGSRNRGIWYVLAARDGTIWAGTEKDGILHFNPDPGTQPQSAKPAVEFYGHKEGLTADLAFTVFEDREGSIWVATTGGIDQFRSAPFRRIGAEQSRFRLQSNAPRERVLAVTDRLVDVTSGAFLSLTPPEKTNGLLCTYQGDDGTVWIGTSAGLLRYDKGRVTSIPLPKDVKDSLVSTVVEDSYHHVWAAIGQEGVFRLDQTGWTKHGGYTGLPNSPPIAALRDHRGDLWFSFGNKVVRISSGALTWFDSSGGENAGRILTLQERNDQLWIGGDGGVAVLDAGRFRTLRLKDSEALRGVSGLVFSGTGDLWLNSSSGAYRIAQDQISKRDLDPEYAVVWSKFAPLDGLDGLPRSPVAPSAQVGPTGKIYFVTGQGLYWADPLHLPINSIPPQVWITGFRTADRDVVPESVSLQLPPRQRNVEISYTATSLLIPERVRFRYRLQGFDRDWIEAGIRRKAYYSAIPPGTYTFQVVACNDSGLWNPTAATLSITVLPTFTETIWFKLLMAIAVGGLLWIVYLFRLKQATAAVQERLLAQMEERERIARELHDTLLQGFQGITLRMQGVSKNMSVQDPLRKMMEDVLDRGDEVLREARQRVRNLRRRTTDENELPDRLTKCGQQLSKDHAAIFTLAIVGELRVLESTVQDEAYRIAAEALTNAFRHASASKIETEVTYDSSALRITVRDDGVGIDKEMLSNGQPGHWGLTGMRERAHAIRAELKLWSRESAGTEVELVIPAAIAYPRDQRKPVESEPFRV